MRRTVILQGKLFVAAFVAGGKESAPKSPTLLTWDRYHLKREMEKSANDFILQVPF